MVTEKYFQGEHIGLSGVLKKASAQIDNIPAYLQILKGGRIVKDVQMTVDEEKSTYNYELDTSDMEGIYGLRVVLKPSASASGIVVSRDIVHIEVLK